MAEVTPIDNVIYKTVVGSLPQAIVILNEKMEILSCNDTFPSLFGLSLSQVYLKRMEEVLPDRDLRKLMNEVQEEGAPREMELLYESGEGEKGILKVLIKRISLTMEGVQNIILVTLEDISEKMRLELEKIHSEKLEDMVQATRCLAHDLGNSLYSVSSTLQFLKEGKSLEKDADMTAEIDFLIENVTQMTNLLRSMFEFNYSEGFQFHQEDVHGVIKRTIALMGKEAMRRQIVIDTDFSTEAPPFWIDKRQLEHLFLNLLKNAMESMTEGGQIWIKTSFCPVISEEREGYVTIDVRDTGSGIPEEYLKYIFKPFFSLKEGEREGHGLGLYICQQIVEKHHGRITVKSERGKGAIFTITIPVLYSSP